MIVDNELKSILDYRSKVKGICEVLTRDHMKVAFFGRFVFFVCLYVVKTYKCSKICILILIKINFIGYVYFENKIFMIVYHIKY